MWTCCVFLNLVCVIQIFGVNIEVLNRFNNDINLIKSKSTNPINNNIAKNVVLFLGDGMSVTTVTAARIRLGQMNGGMGEESQLSFETFPYTGLSKVFIITDAKGVKLNKTIALPNKLLLTYCIDAQVADSACSTTAYMSGVKNNIGTIGVTQDVTLNNCTAMLNKTFHSSSIVEWAQASGKGTGLVTTTRITDASPVGGYAHTANRDWETDSDVAKNVKEFPELCEDIAKQLVKNEPGRNIKVILAGGTRAFIPKSKNDNFGNPGYRTADVDLIAEWEKDKSDNGKVGKYIWQKNQLLGLDLENTDYVLGLFGTNDLDYHLDAQTTQPTLEEMTTIAIKKLQKEEKGFFLFVEGGMIDSAHHANKAKKSLDETIEFHKAIEAAMKLTKEEDTLIVVTADHGHTLSMNGYPERGSDILTTVQEGGDGLPYSTLTYANGPSAVNYTTGIRRNISADQRGEKDYRFPALFYRSSETHSGDDVAVYARGPSAHLLSGNYEQSYIAHVMGYAARIGPAAESLKSSAVINNSILIMVLLFMLVHTLMFF